MVVDDCLADVAEHLVRKFSEHLVPVVRCGGKLKRKRGWKGKDSGEEDLECGVGYVLDLQRRRKLLR